MPQPPHHSRAASLLMQHYTQLYGFVYACVGSHADVEDVLQEVSVVVTEKFGQLEEESGFLAWAREIARREVLAWYKRTSRLPNLFDPATIDLIYAAAEHQNDRGSFAERQVALTRCLDELPPKSREVVCLRYAGTDNVEQLARRIGRTLSATYGLLKRIRVALRKCVEQRLAEGGA